MKRLRLPLIAMVLLLPSGCGRLVFKPNQQTPVAAQQQMQTLAQQTQEFQTRATSLDRDNQELESLLAQSRQQIQLLNNELAATRQQLKTTTEQFLALRTDNDQLRTQTSKLVANVQQRPGAEIRPNNSLLRSLSIKDMPGVEVRQDGDVLRVEAPADRIFTRGSAYLQSGAEQYLLSIANDLQRNFPNHLIGVEGHTDASPTHSQQHPTPHHLSAAQALAVYNVLVQRGAAQPYQLFVIGHGANHPIVSNASAEGQARNRRIELVVYPERVAQR